jgi:hypothetical protein
VLCDAEFYALYRRMARASQTGGKALVNRWGKRVRRRVAGRKPKPKTSGRKRIAAASKIVELYSQVLEACSALVVRRGRVAAGHEP